MASAASALYPFGLAVALSALVCLLLWWLMCPQKRACGFLVLCVPLGVLVSRAFYCVSRLSWFLEKGFGWFWKWNAGGFTFYGMIFGVLLAAFIASRIHHSSFGELMDSVAPYLALFCALCRFCHWFAKPAAGIGYDLEAWFDYWQENTGMSLFLTGADPAKFSFFPIALQGNYDLWYWAIFSLEGLLMLGVFAFVMCRRQEAPLGRTLLFLLVTALCSMVTESMKQDGLRLGFVKIGQMMAVVIILTVFVIYIVSTRRYQVLWSRFPLLLCCLSVDVAMEFAVEKKITAIASLPVFGCHLITALMSVLMALLILPLRKQQGVFYGNQNR